MAALACVAYVPASSTLDSQICTAAVSCRQRRNRKHETRQNSPSGSRNATRRGEHTVCGALTTKSPPTSGAEDATHICETFASQSQFVRESRKLEKEYEPACSPCEAGQSRSWPSPAAGPDLRRTMLLSQASMDSNRDQANRFVPWPERSPTVRPAPSSKS